MRIPDFVTHYYLGDKQPFQNLSTLEEPLLSEVIADLARRRSSGLKRVFGPKYIALRKLTEQRLYNLFVAAGGAPERKAPHYFCLGECAWFRGLSPDMREVRVPLAALPDSVTSFTYPDSVVSMGFGPQFGLPDVPRPYHGRAFRKAELAHVVSQFGLPSAATALEYEGYWKRSFEIYVEVQVWADAPLIPSSAMKLRSYAPHDWQAVREIYDLSKPDEMRGSVDLAVVRPWEEDEVHVALFYKASVVVAESHGQVVGFGGHQEDRIEWLYVHPAHRRRGVATALVRHLLAAVGGTVRLNVAANNVAARRLYEGLGFAIDREFVGKFNGQDVHVVSMKSLNPPPG